MQRRLFPLVAVSLCVGRLFASDLKVEATFDGAAGKTKISWADAAVGQADDRVSIYRSEVPITAESLPFAKRVATRIPAKSGSFDFAVSDTGPRYYTVFKISEAGQEIREFGPNVTSVVTEKDMLAPAPVELRTEIADGKLLLAWNGASEAVADHSAYKVYARASANAGWRLITTVDSNGIIRKGSKSAMVLNSAASPQETEYQVTAVDASGNESGASNAVSIHQGRHLTISGEDSVARNNDLSVSKMYPVPGEEVSLGFVVHNRGTQGAKNVSIVVTASKNGDLPRKVGIVTVPEIPAFSAVESKVAWKPESAGRWEFRIEVDPAGQVDKAPLKGRTAKFEMLVPESELRFIWYGGEADKLKYANVIHPVLLKDMPEWKRRGATPYALMGVGDTPKIEGLCDRAIEDGYAGACFDEIGKTSKDLPALLEILPYIKQRHPDFYIGLWQIGEFDENSIIALKKGDFDQFLVEVYLKLGQTPLSVLEKAIKELQDRGISRQCVIGLGLDRSLFLGKSPDEQIEFLTEQMKLIRKMAPEIPGLAFFSYDSADPQLVKRVDELCAELYFPKKS